MHMLQLAGMQTSSRLYPLHVPVVSTAQPILFGLLYFPHLVSSCIARYTDPKAPWPSFHRLPLAFRQILTREGSICQRTSLCKGLLQFEMLLLCRVWPGAAGATAEGAPWSGGVSRGLGEEGWVCWERVGDGECLLGTGGNGLRLLDDAELMS